MQILLLERLVIQDSYNFDSHKIKLRCMTLLLAEDNKLKIAYGIKGLHILEFLPDEMGDNILTDFLYWFAPETLRAMEFTDGLIFYIIDFNFDKL